MNQQLCTAEPKIIRTHFSIVVERPLNKLNSISYLNLEEAPPDKQRTISRAIFHAD